MKNVKKYVLYFIIFLIIIIGASRWRVVFVSNGHIFTVDIINKLDDCQNVIILGAGVRDDGSMSPILEERAITAVDLYERGKACQFIISGTKGEVYVVKDYLIQKNISKDIIRVDENGIDTFTSMKNVRDIYSIDSAIVITQDFHLQRAVYLARILNIDADGYEAYKYYPYMVLEEDKYTIRDWLASVKAVWQGELLMNN